MLAVQESFVSGGKGREGPTVRQDRSERDQNEHVREISLFRLQ
jgi:hypothetical protein